MSQHRYTAVSSSTPIRPSSRTSKTAPKTQVPTVVVIPPHDKMGVITDKIQKIVADCVDLLSLHLVTRGTDPVLAGDDFDDLVDDPFTDDELKVLLQSEVEKIVIDHLAKPITQLKEAYYRTLKHSIPENKKEWAPAFALQRDKALNVFSLMNDGCFISKRSKSIVECHEAGSDFRSVLEACFQPLYALRIEEKRYQFQLTWPTGATKIVFVNEAAIPEEYFGTYSGNFMMTPQMVKCEGAVIPAQTGAAQCLDTFTADATDQSIPICPCGGELKRTDLTAQRDATLAWILKLMEPAGQHGVKRKTA